MLDKEFSVSEALYTLAKWASSHDEHRQTVLEVWKNKFNISNDDYVLRFLLLIKATSEHLIEVLNDANIREESKVQYKKSLKAFNNLISGAHLYNSWNSVKNSCATPEIVAFILGATDAASSALPKEIIPHEELENLCAKINSVKSQINEDMTNSVLKRHLIKELDFMLVCIDRFDFVGSLGLEDSSGKILQKCIVNRTQIPPNLFKKLSAVALKTFHILAVIGSASKGVEAISNGAEWLKQISSDIQRADISDIKLLEHQSNSEKTETNE